MCTPPRTPPLADGTSAFVPYSLEQLEVLINDALRYAENKNRSSSSASPATPEATPDVVAEPTQTQPDPTPSLPGITYTDRNDFVSSRFICRGCLLMVPQCLYCHRSKTVDRCEFLPGMRPCTRCKSRKIACGLYPHHLEPERSAWKEKQTAKTLRKRKVKTRPAAVTRASSEGHTVPSAPKAEPFVLDPFSDAHGGLHGQDTAVGE